MPRRSDTGNVRKICDCAKWKECAHAWYVDFKAPKFDPVRPNERYRKNLDVLIGRHASDLRDAQAEARRAIVAWQTGRDPKGLVPSDDPTLTQMLAAFDRERPRGDRWQIGAIQKAKVGGRAFGDYRIGAITADVLRQFRATRPKVAGNRDLALLRAAFNWAVLGGLLPTTPFKVGTVTAVKLAREEPRSRRLQGDEAKRLLEAAGGLRDIITAALETGMRKGEILSLQWHQVMFSPKAEIFLPAGKTKTKRDRRIPISSVLREVLERRRLDPAGEPLPPDGYVFGNEIGQRRRYIRTAWVLTLKRAKITGLHLHDLRREAGSRWLDGGLDLVTIQRWLGHANVSQTSVYLGASLGADEQNMRLFEERMGRVQPLPHVAISPDANGSQPTSTNAGTPENTQQSAIVR